MITDNFCFYFQNRLIQTSQTGGQQYSYTSPLVFPAETVSPRWKDLARTSTHASFYGVLVGGEDRVLSKLSPGVRVGEDVRI
jgi:hypothetical protein